MDIFNAWVVGAAGVFLFVVIAYIVAREKGWIGGDARDLELIAKTEHELGRLKARLQARIDKRAATAAKAQPAMPMATAATNEKDMRIAYAKSLFDAGTINQAQFDAAVAAELKPPTP